LKSITQASEILGISGRRLRVLCAQGRVSGAVKVGGMWILPDNPIVSPAGRVRPGKIKLKG
jgi:predicted site-specific integrase-resolvase